MAVLLADLPKKIGGVTVNRNCASGLDAVNQAAKSIFAEEGDIYIAGGVESMSRAPYSIPKAAQQSSMGHRTLFDTTVGWRYPNPRMDERYPIISLGETAENIAEEFGESVVWSKIRLLWKASDGQLMRSTIRGSRKRYNLFL
ncbi:MAG: hypothetical protein Ct9H300mP9_6750 [Candidatus Neomarinimicrobiota bacterium]|nr:MAG: hypothetical protein Ct9H300mP9_6750 [Candidatus Neomarinimicrobiota bacterium]